MLNYYTFPYDLKDTLKEFLMVSLIGTFSYFHIHVHVCSVSVNCTWNVCNTCDVYLISTVLYMTGAVINTCMLYMTGAGGPEPPKKLLPSSDYLYNMTARNVSDWLVKTMEKYQKRRSVTTTILRSILCQVLLKMLITVLYQLDSTNYSTCTNWITVVLLMLFSNYSTIIFNEWLWMLM